jgi:hypothetical protein
VNGNVTYQGTKLISFYDTSAVQTRTAGAVQEGGHLADVIGWARWTGESSGLYATQGPNGGLHVLSGTATVVSTLPTSGTAQYALAGSTNPTLSDGSAAPGTLTGAMAVQFGSTTLIGYDITVNVGQFGWNVKTLGGVTIVSQSALVLRADGSFVSRFSQTDGVTALNAASCSRACSGSINGRFFGPGGSHIGLVFNMLDAGATNVTATGIGIFAK